MIVWIVEESFDYEGRQCAGIYSTERRALNAQKAILAGKHSCDSVIVTRVEINRPPNKQVQEIVSYLP